MENKIKFCVVCGRRIPELSRRKITCGPFCRKRKKCGYAPYINYDHPPFEDLTTFQQKAQEAGLSYGKYVALYCNNKEHIVKPLEKEGVWIHKDSQVICSVCGYIPPIVGERKPLIAKICPQCKSVMKKEGGVQG